MKYQSIGQFRQTIKHIISCSRHAGEIPPKIDFQLTTKIHGSNAGICFKPDGSIQALSRSNVLSIGNDNYGWCKFITETNRDIALQLRDLIVGASPYKELYVFGEWFGKGIHKGVAVNNIEKTYAIFDAFCFDDDGTRTHFRNGILYEEAKRVDEFKHRYNNPPIFNHPSVEDLNENRIFFIEQFGELFYEIDFSNPASVEADVEKLIEITQKIEDKCPVGEYFGHNGTGEGLVAKPVKMPEWLDGDGLVFKVKGQKHSNTKVKKTVSIDPEVLSTVIDFVEYAITENRVKQAIFECGVDTDAPDVKKHTGSIIKWVMNDVFKEEIDTILTNKIDTKLVGKYGSERTRNIYFKLIDLV